MRGLRQNGKQSGSALQQQGKSRRHRQRGLGARHLLQLLVLLAAQQGFSLVEGKSLSRFILQPAAVVVGTLLAPQPAQAQTPTTSLTAIAGNGKVTLSWTAENVGATYSGPPPCTNYAWSKWQYKQKTGSGTFGSPIDISTTRSTRSHEVTGLMNGTVYEFIVQARYDCTTADTFILVGLSGETPATPTTKIITLSTASTTITEGDSNKDVSITVTLSEAAPEGGMIVYLEPGDAGTVVVPDDLTCTNNLPAGTDVCFVDAEVTFAEGDTQKTATIRILGDTTDERDETLVIYGSAGDGDGSSTLEEWSVQLLTITITDDDSTDPGVTISKSALTVAEGASTTYTVKLNTEPGGNVTVTPTSSDTGAATVSGALNFTTGNWETAQTVTVTGEADTDTSNESVPVSHGVTGYGSVTSGPNLTVTVTDTTVAAPVLTTATSTGGHVGIVWTHSGRLLSSGSRFFYWEVSYRPKGGTWINETPSGTASQRRVNNVGSDLPDGMLVEVRIRARGEKSGGSLLRPGSVVYGPWSNVREVTVQNSDDSDDLLTFSSSSVTVGVGATSTYTVAMDDDYYGVGVVSVSSSDTNKATVSPSTLTFTTSTYNTAQTVTVTGVATGGSPQINHSFRLTGATADAIPDAGSVGVTVNNKTITLSADSTTIEEGDSGRKDVTITVRLGEAAPSNNFNINFSLDSASTGTATTNSFSSQCANPVPADADIVLESVRWNSAGCFI